jgi:hypothetical protein
MSTAQRHPRSPKSLCGALILASALAACEKSSTEVETDTALSRTGVESLVEALHGVHAFQPAFERAGNPWACPKDGSISWGAWISSEDAEIRHDAELSFNGCAAPDAGEGLFVIDGSLASQIVYHTDELGRYLGTAAGTTEGRIAWTFSGERGSCGVDVAVSSTGSVMWVAGTVCGRSIDRPLD